MAEAASVHLRNTLPVKRSKDLDPETGLEFDARFGWETEYPDWPEVGDYLWDMFWDANRDRRFDDNVPQALGSQGFGAWAASAGKLLNTAEFQILRAMDSAWLNTYRELRAEEAARVAKWNATGKQ